jgi:hypothetical protein
VKNLFDISLVLKQVLGVLKVQELQVLKELLDLEDIKVVYLPLESQVLKDLLELNIKVVEVL